MTDQNTPSNEDKVEDKAPLEGDRKDKAEESQAPLQKKDSFDSTKFDGKTSEEIIKAYGELQRKLGEQSKTVEEAKKLKENQKILAEVILSDPNLTKQVEDRLTKYQKGELHKAGSGGEEANDSVSDLRKAAENRAISEFSHKFGLDDLKAEDKSEVLKKVGQELADLVDPSGKKTMSEVLSSVSLEKLPKLLEKSYYLSHMDKIMSGDSSEVDKEIASIGRLSSSSSKSDPNKLVLTEDEIKMAKNLGVSEEKYLAQKKKLKNK